MRLVSEIGRSSCRMSLAKPVDCWIILKNSSQRGEIVNLPELMKRAYRESITDAELAEVARMVANGGHWDPHTLMRILGRAGSAKYREIVEPYLRDVGDAQLSALAVQVLCSSWDLARDYREELLSFLRGVDWDDEGYVKLQTISSVGEYLRKNSDDELLRMIYDIFSDARERPLIRAAAYNALCRSEGMEWKDIVPTPRVLDSSTEINREVLDRVEKKLRTKAESSPCHLTGTPIRH
jgi:hypothetical protein